MTQYRKKPVVIDAVQYVECGKLVRGMCNSTTCYGSGNEAPHVHTIHDNQIVLLAVGDWIIPEPDGEHFYPCKPDIFAAIYEPAAALSKTDGKPRIPKSSLLRIGDDGPCWNVECLVMASDATRLEIPIHLVRADAVEIVDESSGPPETAS